MVSGSKIAKAQETARQPSENIYIVGTANGPIQRKCQIGFREYIYSRKACGVSAAMLTGEALLCHAECVKTYDGFMVA